MITAWIYGWLALRLQSCRLTGSAAPPSGRRECSASPSCRTLSRHTRSRIHSSAFRPHSTDPLKNDHVTDSEPHSGVTAVHSSGIDVKAIQQHCFWNAQITLLWNFWSGYNTWAAIRCRNPQKSKCSWTYRSTKTPSIDIEPSQSKSRGNESLFRPMSHSSNKKQKCFYFLPFWADNLLNWQRPPAQSVSRLLLM